MVSKFEQTSEREIFRRLVDGSLDEVEFSAVEQRLLSDTSFRERYVRAMGIEAGLYEAFSFPGTFTEPLPQRTPPGRVFALGGLCATLLFAFVGWLFWSSTPAKHIAAFNGSNRPGVKPVAMITQSHAYSGDIKPGMRIKPGKLTLERGQIQLEFFNGAQINVEGPAELDIVSSDAAALISGRASVRVPAGARGFILSTPDAAIVDLGTEFAVSVDDSGDSEVHVVEGEVAVSLLGGDGNTLTSEFVTEAKSVRINGRPPSLEQIDSPGVAFPGIQPQISAPLRVGAEYVRAVRASQPDIYWRFEELTDGLVANEMGPRWAGKIHTAPDDRAAIVVSDGVARFSATGTPHRLEPIELLPGFTHETFSIELWVSPNSFHWATLVAVVPEENVERNFHLSLLELPYKSALVYTPGSFRFLHRYPLGINGGTNLFTDGDCTPGLWHYLVAAKTPTGMKLYLNGRLIRSISETLTGDGLPCRFYMGQLYEGLTDRQLSGAIDEFAVYMRELSDEEIQQHYRAMDATHSFRLD